MNPEFTPLGFPFIRECKGVTRNQIDRVATVLTLLLREGDMSQMALTIGLCNSLSFSFEAMLRKVHTQEEGDMLREVEENLEHIVNVLGYRRRNGLEPLNIPQNKDKLPPMKLCKNCNHPHQLMNTRLVSLSCTEFGCECKQFIDETPDRSHEPLVGFCNCESGTTGFHKPWCNMVPLHGRTKKP